MLWSIYHCTPTRFSTSWTKIWGKPERANECCKWYQQQCHQKSSGEGGGGGGNRVMLPLAPRVRTLLTRSNKIQFICRDSSGTSRYPQWPCAKWFRIDHCTDTCPTDCVLNLTENVLPLDLPLDTTQQSYISPVQTSSLARSYHSYTPGWPLI